MSQNLPESEAESLSFIKESLIYMILCSIWNAFRESTAYALVNRFCAWIDCIVSNSMLFGWVTGQNPEQPPKSQVFTRLHAWLNQLFHALRLDKLLCGSMFTKPLLWGALAMILAPVAPTIVVLALVLASFLSMLCVFGIQSDRQLAYSPVNKWMYFYAAIYLFATVTSVSMRGSLYVGALTVFFLLFYTVLTTFVTKWSQLIRLLYAMTGVGALVALYGFWQYLHPDKYAATWLDTDMFSSIALRVYSTLANPNVLGTYLVLIIPIAVALMMTAPGKLKKTIFGIIALMLTVCLLLTYSRGCYLAILFAIAIFLVLYDRRFLVLGILLLALCPLYLPDTIISRFTSIGDTADSSTSYRVNIWMGTLSMLKNYWISGVGPGETAFNEVYPNYALSTITAPHAHNLFLQILCDTGIVGLLVFVFLIIAFLRTCCTAMRTTRYSDARIFQIAMVSAVMGFLLEGMTDYTFYNYRVMFLFWSFLGLGVLFTKADALKKADMDGQTAWHEYPDGKKRIRVMNIISDTNIGGAGRCLINYLKHYDTEKYDVCIVVPKGSALAPECKKLGAFVLEANIAGEKSLELRAIPILRAMVAAAQPDVVHTHGSMSGRFAARGSHAKLIYSRHSAFPVPENMKHGIRNKVNRWINILYADRIISVSPATMENLTDAGVQPERIQIVLNGVEALKPASAEAQTAWRTRCDIQDGDFVIGILARIEEYKGHLLLLEAAAQLKKLHYPFKVLIAGNGDFSDTVLQKIHEMQLEDVVKFLGFTTEVREFLSILDVQANCSYGTEATSLSLLEGFSLGIPAVVSSYGGNPWLVDDGRNGLIFENKNSDDLTRCLRLLMDDRTQLPAMQKGAREIYEERFTGQMYARNIESVYQRVLKK